MFRVRGANAAGVGVASMPSDPLTAKAMEGNANSQTAGHNHVCITLVLNPVLQSLFEIQQQQMLPCFKMVNFNGLCASLSLCIQGSQEMSCAVDLKSGDIVLSFESCQMSEGSQFTWKKDYKEITDFSKGVEIKTEGNQ